MEMERPEWLVQMQDILETLNEGVMILDDCRKILFVNSCMQEMFGLPAADIMGHDGSGLYNEEEYKILQAQIEKRDREGQNRFEFVLPQKDGSRMPVIISSRRFEDPDGMGFAVVTFTDISEQKRAQARLREVNAKIEQRQREIDEDLALAARVQQSLAPQSLVWGGMRVEAHFHPAHTIGGDFGLVSSLDDEHLNLLVCDVSGHGIGSALVANRIYSETMSQLRHGAPLGEMLRHLNSFVLQNIGGASFFFTVAAARVDRGGRRMIFAGAGHPPTMVVTPGREPRLLESRSMVLGMVPTAVGKEAALDVELHPGDRVVLYTDGLSEVFDARGEMLGVTGVQRFVRETSLLPFSEMKQGLLDRVAEWRHGTPTDDVSLVLLEVL
ncbi:MAG TPA: SpoIIE family protein phosphatase [Candidatus Acidoferrales bacterium]|nr:SpoIIE family protein phosphatase [Candidatus Acidoferrales bacterium]